VKLKFLGTRGEIDIKTRLHRMHSSLEISYRGHRVMIDCGADWLRRVHRIQPEAIVLTHAHPDHAWGLKNGAPCRVYATEQTWRILKRFPLADRAFIEPRVPFCIHNMVFEAFAVEHSLRAPAVGYRITAGRTSIFYVPDLVSICEQREAVTDVRVYVGDGASLRRSIIRKRDGSLIGHASIRTQLVWCQLEGVQKALITHCGSQIVGADSRIINADLRALSVEQGVEARVAFDGLELMLP
jgi:phosphoribosyl 1,2-cyclic phosphodiesterase